MSTVVRVEVPATGSSGRADKFVADASGISRAQVQRLISDGRVTRDGVLMRARDVLAPGSVVELDVPDPVAATAAPEHIPLEVIYQDDDMLIVDKPAGLVTHPSPGHDTGTLVNALLGMTAEDGGTLGTIGGIERAGIVHRLDRDTSGLLMVARTDAAQVALQAQLKARRVHKRYLALVSGSVTAQVGRIEAPIGRDPRDRLRVAIVPDGKEAITGYRVRERFALLDAAGARAHHRPDPPDPGPPVVHRPSRRGRPAVLHGCRPPAARRASSGCSCTPGVWSWRRLRGTVSSVPSRPCRAALESVLERLRRDEAVGIS